MASISSPGLGSGLDINGIITKLMQVESQPLTALAKKEAGFQAKLSAFGAMKGALSALQTAAKTLATGSTFTGMLAVSSDSTVLAATAGSTAAAGSYVIETLQRAKNHTLASNTPYATPAATFNTGTLNITVGATMTPIVVGASNNTLDGIRQAINDANIGVTATLINTGGAAQNRLVLTSNTTGSAGALSVTVGSGDAEGGDNPLSGLAGAGLEVIQPADNAQFKVGGITVTRPSNTITDVIAGVTLTLAKETGTATLTVSKNTGATSAAINAFVKAWNDAAGQIKNLTAFDAASKKAAALTGDSTARGIQAQMSSLLSATVSGVGGGIATLSDLGIAVQADGKLATDSVKLQAALDNRNVNLAALFGSTDSANQGIAVRFGAMLEGVVGDAGLIKSRTEGLNASIKDIARRNEALQLRLTQIEKRYRAQFTALDSLIASMTQTSSFLTQQLANLPGAGNTRN